MAKSQKMSALVNNPVFSAYANVATSLTSGAQTKVLFQVEEFDSNSNFASSRFTPTVPGYYQINAQVGFDGSPVNAAIYIFKNTSAHAIGGFVPGTFSGPLLLANALISMNGTTDYIEVIAIHTTGSAINTDVSNSGGTRFSGCLIRGA